MTIDPTTRAQWRAEAARDFAMFGRSITEPMRPVDIAIDRWASRVIALCDELDTAVARIEELQESNKLRDKALPALVEAKRDLAAAQAEVERLKRDVELHPHDMVITKETFKALREDAALLDGLISLADNRQDLVLSHDLVSHDPDVLEWSVELTDGLYFSADNPRDAIRAALAQAREEKP